MKITLSLYTDSKAIDKAVRSALGDLNTVSVAHAAASPDIALLAMDDATNVSLMKWLHEQMPWLPLLVLKPLKPIDGGVLGNGYMGAYVSQEDLKTEFFRQMIEVYAHEGYLKRLLRRLEKRFIDTKNKARKEKDTLAFYDALTQLPNRALFMDRAHQAMAQARRSHTSAAVVILDFDRFKRINDTLGHTVGDELLKDVARRLTAALYETDTVTRLGGDEFGVLLPLIENAEHVTKVVDKIAAVIKRPFYIDKYELHLTASIGVAVCPEDGEDAESVVRNADAALNRARQKGGNQYKMYSQLMGQKYKHRLMIESDLRAAFEKNEFRVYFQPMINAVTGCVTRMEALVRWEHPALGLVAPMEFVPIAEESGLIVPLGEWVLRAACQELKKWQSQGFADIKISVNLSSLQLEDPEFVARAVRILEETGVNAGDIELEITEAAFAGNSDDYLKVIESLRLKGFEFSIDDFGTGYSSLNRIKSFPIRTVKIDQSFVKDITADGNDAAIVEAIILLAHSLKLSVVAEGVETEGQLEFLRQKNCDMIQGFLYSKPVPTDECNSLLTRKCFPR